MLGPSKKDAASSSASPNEAGAEGERATDLPGALGIGTIIDGYQLLCSIGQGGFGAIWMCVNGTSEKRLAIKLVEGEEQVSQELVALRKYVHVAEGNENLIQLEHINSDATRLWLVTPLADSLTDGYTADSYKPRSLANLLRSVGHLPEAEAIHIALRMCRALLTLHRAGLLHGDVAPGNILRVNGRWVLADPGLVRFLGEQGICRNRSYYPDLKASRPYDDLYALGLMLWEMVSGIAEMVSGRDRMRLDERMVEYLSRTDLPIAKLFCHAAAQNPEQRYMNAEEMLHDLESVAGVLEQPSAAQNSLCNLPRLRSLRTGGAPPPLGGVV
jgi:serine/threonine protein kinase